MGKQSELSKVRLDFEEVEDTRRQVDIPALIAAAKALFGRL